jgi:hypothetical protein
MMLDCALAPGSAKAIPLSGEYMFVTGDPNISGSFTSTGTALSQWSFSSDLFDRVFLGNAPPNQTLTWSNILDNNQPGNINNTERFVSHTGLLNVSPGGYYGQLIWNSDPNILNAVFRVDGGCCDAVYFPPPTVSFMSTSVPEDATITYIAIGLLCASIYGCINGGKREVLLP